VGPQLAQEVGAVAAGLAEGRHERGRRDDVAPLGGLADTVVQVQRIRVTESARELLDLAALDRDHERGKLATDERLVELDRHQAWPFFSVRSRNFSRFGMTNRSWRPSAIFSLASHASTWKRNRRPSVSRSVALARTAMPTGVAARWRMSIIVPTVEAPAGSVGMIMPAAACSSSPMT